MSPLLIFFLIPIDCFYIYLSISTTPEALFSERERNVENDEDSIFIYAYIRSSINASRTGRVCAMRCFFFFVRWGGG